MTSSLGLDSTTMLLFRATSAALAILALAAVGAWVLAWIRPTFATRLASFATIFACVLGIAATLPAILRPAPPLDSRIGWTLPTGPVRIGVDGLSAFFLLCIFLVAGLSAVYGAGYLKGHASPRRSATAGGSFALLVASMVTVVVARDGASFLVAWEAMTLSSFLLVTFHDREEEARRAGLVYLIASQIGAALLVALFVVLSGRAGSFAFVDFASNRFGLGVRGACFLLALGGFGLKAGFFPLHVWLPAAHPAAPSHVSALLSGVMIEMGIYGLLRALTLLGPPAVWWGVVVVSVGIVSVVLGVLHALAQPDLKRLLAYSSVENVGIVALGVGLGLLGESQGQRVVAFLGFAGALLHVLNHGLFKGLLFQAAGGVLRATGTREIERLGGLGRRMPVTAAAFFVGSLAISGLPPLNGFVSEWLVFVGALRAGSESSPALSFVAVALVASLALAGGIAAACFVKAHGVVFLGTSRTPVSFEGPEAPPSMRVTMIVGMSACAVLGLFPEIGLRLVESAAGALSGDASPSLALLGPLRAVSRAAAVLVALGLLLALLRARLLRGREARSDETWGCGWALPSARMQYSAESFAAPLIEPFSPLVPSHLQLEPPVGVFPTRATAEAHPGDLASERIVDPIVRRLLAGLLRLRLLQYGRIQLYIAYIFVTLLVVFAVELSMGAR